MKSSEKFVTATEKEVVKIVEDQQVELDKETQGNNEEGLAMAIAGEEGVVTIYLGKEVQKLSFAADDALDFAMKLMAAATTAKMDEMVDTMNGVSH